MQWNFIFVLLQYLDDPGLNLLSSTLIEDLIATLTRQNYEILSDQNPKEEEINPWNWSGVWNISRSYKSVGVKYLKFYRYNSSSWLHISFEHFAIKTINKLRQNTMDELKSVYTIEELKVNFI